MLDLTTLQEVEQKISLISIPGSVDPSFNQGIEEGLRVAYRLIISLRKDAEQEEHRCQILERAKAQKET